MIHVERGHAPDGFAGRRSEWDSKFAITRITKPNITASRFWATIRTEIREDALVLAERHCFKCAYCESKMEHVMPPQIEHYRPKSKSEYESLMFEWSNWLLSCGRCNTTKGTCFEDMANDKRLLDPASEDPAVHIGFAAHLPIALSSRGKETIRKVGLDRAPLNEHRNLWLTVVRLLMIQAVQDSDDIKQMTRRFLIWCMQKEAPYSSMTRAYMAIHAPKLADPAVPHPRVEGENIISEIRNLVESIEPRLAELV